MLTNQEIVKKEDSNACDNEVAALTFTRTTSYASVKSKNSSTLTITKSKTKPKRKVRKPRKVTPTKAKIPAVTSSIKKFLIRNQPNMLIPSHISCKNDAYHSKFPNYPITEDDPMPGDLIMASAGDIGLQAYEMGLLKRNELVFGKAKCFTYLNKTIEGGEGGEPYILKDLELMKVEWSVQPGVRTNRPIDMTRLWVKVLAKKSDPNMMEISEYLKKEVRKHFFFGLPEGWMGLDVDVKKESVV